MIEPASASIAVYLITRGTSTINRDKRLLIKNPIFVKKKVCKLFLKNKEEIINSIIEETNDFLMDSLNIIHIKYLDPSIFLMIYILILFITIIF
jgi:hypothetical protein